MTLVLADPFSFPATEVITRIGDQRPGHRIVGGLVSGRSATADLERRLTGVGPAEGGLLFTCTGRGRRLFGVPDHDVTMIGRELGGPVAGAFCAGEIGPVGDRSELQGFTAAVVVLA